MRGHCQYQNDGKNCKNHHVEGPVWNSFDRDSAICSTVVNESPLAANYLWQFSAPENSASPVCSSSTGDGWLDFSVSDGESLENSFVDPAKCTGFE